MLKDIITKRLLPREGKKCERVKTKARKIKNKGKKFGRKQNSNFAQKPKSLERMQTHVLNYVFSSFYNNQLIFLLILEKLYI